MKVFTNSAISLDGKLGTSSYEHVRMGTAEDLRRMSLLRATADAVLVGGRTWRAWTLPLVEDPKVGTNPRDKPVVNAVLTRSGVGPRSGRYFDDPRTVPVFFGGPDTDLSGFPARVRVHRSASVPDLAWVLDVLEQDHGVERLLVEGGGDLIAQLLVAGLIDELYVTLCPLVVGGADSPTLVDGPGFMAASLRPLELLSHEQVGHELYLHYRVLPGQDGSSPGG